MWEDVIYYGLWIAAGYCSIRYVWLEYFRKRFLR